MNRELNSLLVEMKLCLLEDTHARVVADLEKGYKKGGYHGMMLAAYKLEGSNLKDVRKWIVGVLREVLDSGKIGSTAVKLSSNQRATMTMYRDDLRHGR